MLIRGHELHVVDGGAGTPPLLLVHGFTGSDMDWLDVQPALAKSRRVVSYTHRGHGDSAHTDTYSIDELVADLEAVVDGLGLAPMHLLGHSMGGVVVLRYALAHRDRLASLVLMDTFAAPPGALLDSWIDSVADIVRTDGMAKLVELMRQYTPDMPPHIAERVEYKMSRMDPNAFLELGRALQTSPSVVDRLGELAGIPVTVLVGANDAPLLEPSRVMHDAIPGSELVVIPDTGHTPQEERPDEWLRAIEEHLARAV
jgi:pimeloyl-ACP methyl ester carboxylesterase